MKSFLRTTCTHGVSQHDHHAIEENDLFLGKKPWFRGVHAKHRKQPIASSVFATAETVQPFRRESYSQNGRNGIAISADGVHPFRA